jgi:hypothetical protein
MRVGGWVLGLATALCLASGDAAAQSSCSEPAMCAADRVCLRPVGSCGGSGRCVLDDFNCPHLYEPACGCDGESYVSPCEAQRRGGGAARRGACCVGSCSTSDQVTEHDLRLGIMAGLGGPMASACRSFDRDQSARVTIDELITAVGHAMRGCPRGAD